ncbi:MAG: murein biosynthesis integral membrane protein MurJ [Hyphomicrobiaceae bacterium]|nr:murein biosynthesis integral membrane protein MurJ [Hyphomicrobiaceae bacterium]
MITYKPLVLVGGLTLISRAAGFIRDILIASIFGSSYIADAFFVAFRLPNLFRRLFGEGAFNNAFIPLFASQLEREGELSASSFARDAMSGLSFIMLITSALSIIIMPILILILAPGFASEPEKFNLAVTLSRITFPYLMCMSLVAFLSGILNTYNLFWLSSAAPISLNVILISSIIISIAFGYTNQIEASIIVAFGVTIAGVIQCAILWYGVRKVGIKLFFCLPKYNDSIKALIKLGIPGVISGGITQINIVIGTMIASLQIGAVSVLYYADRLYQLPLGVVGVTIGIVLLPDLSRKIRAGNMAAAHESLNRSLEFALLLTVPASIALTITAHPIINVLFERGSFTPADTTATAQALIAFALGLPAFVLIKVFQPAFFAREDTITPMWFSGISIAANILGSLTLFYWFSSAETWTPMPHVGIALATSIAGWINMLLLCWKLAHKGDFFWDRKLIKNLLVILYASFFMGTLLIIITSYVNENYISSEVLLHRITGLFILVISGVLIFLISIAIFGKFRLRRLLVSKH